MKKLTLLLLGLAVLVFATACATAPDGRRRYLGPTVQASLGFDRLSFGITLVGDPDLPPVKLPAPTGK